jgi:hypothetical protein
MYVYICIHVSSEQMMRCVCVCVVLSIQPKCHPPLQPYLPGGKREGNKCVLREDDDDIPRLCVSLAVFLFFFYLFLARLSVKKKLFLLPCRKFILLSLPIYAVNQSFRLYTHMRLSSFNALSNVLRQA